MTNSNTDDRDNSNENSGFADPEKIVAEAGIKKGDVVADFGCGSGHFSFSVADLVGESGKVFAIDILPSSLESIDSHLKTNGINNIHPKRVDLESYGSTGLESEEIDWVILKNVLSQNEDKKSILDEAHRIIKTGGKVLILAWNQENFLLGPKKELRISSEDLKHMIEDVGFIFDKNFPAGKYHYVTIATKP